MSQRGRVSSLALAFGLILGHALVADAGFVVGGNYQLELTNFPVSSTSTQTINLVQKTVNTNLTLLERIIPDGTNGEWLEFNFRTVNGGPLAGNLNANWQAFARGIPLTEPSRFTGVYYYWSINGTPVSPINPFGSLPPVGPIPTNPALGPAYVGFFNFPDTFPNFDLFAFSNPYSFIGPGGNNPNLVNGFTMAVRATAVPEPGSAILTGLGLVGGAAALRRIRRSPERC